MVELMKRNSWNKVPKWPNFGAIRSKFWSSGSKIELVSRWSNYPNWITRNGSGMSQKRLNFEAIWSKFWLNGSKIELFGLHNKKWFRNVLKKPLNFEAIWSIFWLNGSKIELFGLHNKKWFRNVLKTTQFWSHLVNILVKWLQNRIIRIG